MGDRAYLSIGEVLSLLQEEFPDVTISKIRFLESQGLLDPERTASGYRKFYNPDVDRLRWILRQQREHFLPLKVIKGRLGVESADGAEDDDPDDHDEVDELGEPTETVVPATVPETVASNAPNVSGADSPDAADTRPAAAAAAAAVEAAVRFEQQTNLSAGMSSVSLTLEELSAATGLPYERIRELERHGFLAGRAVAGTVYYDEEALVVANLAVGFAKFGIEGRHLRIYKNSAEREAGLFEQIVTPLLKQRNPEARRQAVASLEELTQLGQRLRAAVLRQALRRLSGG